MNELVKKTLVKNYELYIELLDNDEFKKHLVRELNEDIDIPIINEKTERKVLNSIYKVIISSLKKIDIEKMLDNIEN
uniref:Uncharacterized protein n=1 Tax=Florenciella sp. virus SA2 TaxID=3240092 RepID=A0AB39JBB3_9VIRU